MSQPNPGDPTTPNARTRRRVSAWTVLGVIVAALIAVAGLVVVGFVLVAFVGMRNYGSNK